MLIKITQIFMAHALNLAAFSILGLLFITKSSTFVPVLILIVGALLLMFSKPLRIQQKFVFVQSDFKWIARAFLFWFVALLALTLIHQGGDKVYFPDNALRMLAATVLLAVLLRSSTQKYFLVGLFVAGVAAAFWAIFKWPLDASQRVVATTNNPIHFGNLSALVMLLSITVGMLAQRLSLKVRLLFYVAAVGGGGRCIGFDVTLVFRCVAVLFADAIARSACPNQKVCVGQFLGFVHRNSVRSNVVRHS